MIALAKFIASFEASPLQPWATCEPWEITSNVDSIVRKLLATLPTGDFIIDDEVAIHRTATVEENAVLKGPLILSADCLVAAGAYLRGGNWIAERCIFGPGAELKSSFVFSGSKLAHFNFVGDSIVGEDVNLEAGSIICNYRNEREAKEVFVRVGQRLKPTGCNKFGAVIGDHSRIGANAIVAPGALIERKAIVGRGALRDDEQSIVERSA